MMVPIRIRYPLVLPIVIIVLGLLLLLLGVITTGPRDIVLGAIFLILGTLQVVGVVIVVEAHEVQLKNPVGMTVRRTPIHGLADLRMDGKKLVRAGDGKKIAGLGPLSARSSDVDALRQAIAQAGPGA